MNNYNKKCVIDDCISIVGTKGARGLCPKHYRRWKIHRDPFITLAKRYKSIAQKLIEHTSFPENLDECWLWRGQRQKTGHGKFYWKGKYTSAHRAMYKQFVSSDIDGLDVDHLCKNPPCVNLSHLEAVTSRINTLRGSSPSAVNALKTHCLNGHEFTAENTKFKGRHRTCITCRRARWVAGYNHRKAEAKRLGIKQAY